MRKVILLVVAIVIAAVGATLVMLYVQGINTRALADQDPVKVLTVTSAISAGESVTAIQQEGKLELTDLPASTVLDGALTSTESISSDVALSAIYPGEQVLAAKFGNVADAQTTGLSIPKSKMAISVQLDDPARVAGFVTPGSHVAIFYSTVGGFTRVLLPDVLVIGAGQTTVLSTTTTDESGAATTEEIPKTILTVGVDQLEADKVIFASKNGELSFGLLPQGTKVRNDLGVTVSNLFK